VWATRISFLDVLSTSLLSFRMPGNLNPRKGGTLAVYNLTAASSQTTVMMHSTQGLLYKWKFGITFTVIVQHGTFICPLMNSALIRLSNFYNTLCFCLYCTVLYCAVPYRTVPYRTVPYRTVPYRTVLYSQHDIHNIPYCTV
jgi:hypothetical protein